MKKIEQFSSWMEKHSKLSKSSIYKYSRAIRTISNDMVKEGVIEKTLFDMKLLELDIAISQILQNKFFLEKNFRGNNMYSNSLKQFRYFCYDTMMWDESEIEVIEEIKSTNLITDTEKDCIIKSIIGQGKYRDGLIKKYDAKCIVTGINIPRLLIASHIKPWSVCCNDERIDVENGLLLCPNIDKLFDCGLITFDNGGKMKKSSFLGRENIKRFHIDEDIIVELKASQRMLDYLEYHRDVLFVK